MGKSFHHSPSLGGKSEKAKYDRLYQQTLATYRIYFGAPPPDIWLNYSATRLRQKYWIIPNPIAWLRLKNK